MDANTIASLRQLVHDLEAQLRNYPNNQAEWHQKLLRECERAEKAEAALYAAGNIANYNWGARRVREAVMGCSKTRRYRGGALGMRWTSW